MYKKNSQNHQDSVNSQKKHKKSNVTSKRSKKPKINSARKSNQSSADTYIKSSSAQQNQLQVGDSNDNILPTFTDSQNNDEDEKRTPMQQRRWKTYQVMLNRSASGEDPIPTEILQKAQENLKAIDQHQDPPHKNFRYEIQKQNINALNERLSQKKKKVLKLEEYHFLYDAIRYEEFLKGIWAGHAEDLASASEHYTFAIRSTGENSVKRIAEGAKPKPHTILEKSIKKGSFESHYLFKNTIKHGRHWRTVIEYDLDGFVGHWQGNELRGVRVDGIEKHFKHIEQHADINYTIDKIESNDGYMVGNPGGFTIKAYADNSAEEKKSTEHTKINVKKFTRYKGTKTKKGFKVSKDTDGNPVKDEEGYIIELKMDEPNGMDDVFALQAVPEWQQYLYTGDYDLHEEYKKSGGFNMGQIPEGSDDKVHFLQRLNEEISKNPMQVFREGKTILSKQRIVHVKDGDYAMFQHGDQATYITNQLNESRRKTEEAWEESETHRKQRQKLLKSTNKKPDQLTSWQESNLRTDFDTNMAELKQIESKEASEKQTKAVVNAKIVSTVAKEEQGTLIWFHNNQIYITMDPKEHAKFREQIQVKGPSIWSKKGYKIVGSGRQKKRPNIFSTRRDLPKLKRESAVKIGQTPVLGQPLDIIYESEEED